jgi:hypothetical protein
MTKYQGIRGTLEERFWRYVSPEPNSGCWLWDGSWCKGYGVIGSPPGHGGVKQLMATHVSLALHGWPRPSRDLQACHHCDVPACVNPEHLYWGSGRENRKDMFIRGRANLPTNGAHVNAKLTEDQVRYIRGSGKLQRALAAEFSVCRQLISQIRAGRARRHVQ